MEQEQTRTALITGANKGIGREVARRLLDSGYTVWIGARDDGRGTDAAEALGPNARFVQIDVTDDASIRDAVQTIAEAGGLDVLVNNAGITVPDDSDDPRPAFQAVFDVNVFGAVAVTYAVLPLLRASPAPRIVNVSSGLGSLSEMSDPDSAFYAITKEQVVYPASKAALNMVTVQMAKALGDGEAGRSFKVNAADPGYTATDFNGHSGPQTVEEAAEVVVRLATLAEDGPTGGFYRGSGEVAW